MGKKKPEYLGDRVIWCPRGPYDWANTFAVAVSGTVPNVFGHLILNVGGCGPTAQYFHATGSPTHDINWWPLELDQAGYVRYLLENRKIEWRRWRVQVPDPRGAQQRLEHLLMNKWLWLVLPHNCVAFVEDVIQHGGAKNEEWPSLPYFVHRSGR
jgi:hypothetical protein